MPKREKSFPLSIFLSKKGVSREECVDQNKAKAYSAKPVPLSQEIEGDLYSYTSDTEPPDWIRYIEPILKSKASKKSLFKPGSTNSGLLVINISKVNRCAIFAFGYGKALIQYDNVEQFFGRNVVLNSIETNKIQAMKSRSYDRQPRHKENQGTITADLNEFDIDFQTEILQKLTGQYPEKYLAAEGLEDGKIGTKITGHDAVSLTTTLPINQINDLCKWLCKVFESDRYKTKLPDIDSFMPVKGESITAKLNTYIVRQIKEGELEGLHFSAPSMLETEEYLESSITGLGKRGIEAMRGGHLTVEQFHKALDEAGRLEDLDLISLKNSYKLVCFSNQESSRHRYFSLFRCLSGEIRLDASIDKSLSPKDNGTYALMDGEWYKIEKDFYDKIVKSLNRQVASSLIKLNPIVASDSNEFEYNERQCNEHGHLLFDQDNVPLRGRGTVEICDILCTQGNLVHVKKYSASSTLSHLFSQGYVSIKSLMEDDTFKDKFLAKISPPARRSSFRRKLESRKTKVVYVVLMKGSAYHTPAKKIENLPAFSIVNLNKFSREIKALGFEMRIQFVFS